jgi:hypothetical protein
MVKKALHYNTNWNQDHNPNQKLAHAIHSFQMILTNFSIEVDY